MNNYKKYDGNLVMLCFERMVDISNSFQLPESKIEYEYKIGVFWCKDDTDFSLANIFTSVCGPFVGKLKNIHLIREIAFKEEK